MMIDKKLLLIFSLLFLALSLNASSVMFASNLPYKEGIITYKISGNKSGFAKAYFKEYGKKIAFYIESYSHILRKKHHQKTLILINDKRRLEIDLLEKKAYQQESLRSELTTLFSYLDTKDQEYLLTNPSETILDLECEEIVIDGKKECVNGSLPLLISIDIFGYQEHIEATQIKKSKVDESFFEVPKDIFITQRKSDLRVATKIISMKLE